MFTGRRRLPWIARPVARWERARTMAPRPRELAAARFRSLSTGVRGADLRVPGSWRGWVVGVWVCGVVSGPHRARARRQVSCNSIYGFFGATNGPLPCVALAATVTAVSALPLARPRLIPVSRSPPPYPSRLLAPALSQSLARPRLTPVARTPPPNTSRSLALALSSTHGRAHRDRCGHGAGRLAAD